MPKKIVCHFMPWIIIKKIVHYQNTKIFWVLDKESFLEPCRVAITRFELTAIVFFPKVLRNKLSFAWGLSFGSFESTLVSLNFNPMMMTNSSLPNLWRISSTLNHISSDHWSWTSTSCTSNRNKRLLGICYGLNSQTRHT